MSKSWPLRFVVENAPSMHKQVYIIGKCLASYEASEQENLLHASNGAESINECLQSLE